MTAGTAPPHPQRMASPWTYLQTNPRASQNQSKLAYSYLRLNKPSICTVKSQTHKASVTADFAQGSWNQLFGTRVAKTQTLLVKDTCHAAWERSANEHFRVGDNRTNAPDMYAVDESDEIPALSTSEPGANRSTQLP